MPLRDRLIAYLPRYARFAAKLAPLLNLRDRAPGLAWLSEALLGLSARRTLPRWRRPWSAGGTAAVPADVLGDGRDVILFADTFNRYFEPDNLAAAQRVLAACGYRVHHVAPADGGRALCCGRTFLASGLVDEARAEARRTVATLRPFVARGARVVGLEPSCLLTFRDELTVLLPPEQAAPLAKAAVLLEECLAADLAAGRISPRFHDQGGRVAHLHGHCHQKAFAVMGAVEQVLRAVPGLDVRPIEFELLRHGRRVRLHGGAHRGVARDGGAQPAAGARKAGAGDLIVADGTSCRHQIADGIGREAVHVVRVLDGALGA